MKKRVMCVHTALVREGSVLYGGKNGKRNILTTKEAVEFAAPFFEGADKELVYVCAVDTKMQPVSMEMVAKGGRSMCCMDMTQIFKSAILVNAAGIFCYHNHPSGVTEASEEDLQVTKRLRECGELLGIHLLDHIIMGADGAFTSIRELEYQEDEVPDDTEKN